MEAIDLKEMQQKIADLELRLSKLEKVGGNSVSEDFKNQPGGKQKTLREIVKGKKFKNGQEKIAVIVGYSEQVLGTLIKKEEISKVWKDVKFEGSYKTNLLDDADGALVRVHSNGDCDLTQGGEDFFEELTKYESPNPASK